MKETNLQASNAILAIARSMYGRRLRENNYRDLLAKPTIADVVTYLKNETYYGNALEPVQDLKGAADHRVHVEHLLRASVYEKCGKMLRFRFTDDKEDFFSFLVLKSEVDEILTCVRLIATNSKEPYDVVFPQTLLDYSKIDLKAVATAQTFEELLSVLRYTDYYPILESQDLEEIHSDPTRLTMVEADLIEFYYDKIFGLIRSQFDGMAKEQLEEMFYTEIDIMNISLIYRMKTFFNCDDDFIRNSIISAHTSMDRKILDDLIASTSPQQVVEILQRTDYRKDFEHKGIQYAERFSQLAKNRMAKKFIRGSIEVPVVFVSYIMLLNIEVENIINIIEGKKYEIPADEIEKLLIF
ncbi:V-type ATPase subunit [Youxingia wuxianensis]|uniref:V-type ATPase subunit n=1 Tax=Youxingia wuxianensis TaxID=2763678 RepID=A0A926EPR3_9FIRM|nr:V-type ATPase subunit [Youxingia wuxianensis]MBC8584094.1 V-type ATPase subunit [Youxingia wuxianensis]